MQKIFTICKKTQHASVASKTSLDCFMLNNRVCVRLKAKLWKLKFFTCSSSIGLIKIDFLACQLYQSILFHVRSIFYPQPQA